jgi:lysine-N-methylase
MTRFRCLASDCEATCCGGGSVPVEQSTHRRLTLLAEGDADAQALLAQGVELLPQAPSSASDPGQEFARLRFLPSGGCSMLDSAGLCRVQSKFGHDALFDVCVTYPRYVNEVDGDAELFGALSCPEVARLALLSEDGFEHELVELSEAPRKLRNRFSTERPYFQPYRLVHAALVRLLGEPGFSLSEKLFVALWIADQLRKVLHARCSSVPTAELQAVLGALGGPGVVPQLAATYRGLKIDAGLPLAVIWYTLPPAAHDRPGAQTERFDAMIRQVWATYGRAPAAGASTEASEEQLRELWAHYVDARAAVPGKVQARIDTCLSRYATNHLLTTPYMLNESLFAYAYELVIRVAILRFLLQTRLSAFAGTPAELDAHIVEVIYSFVRGVDHAELLSQVQRLLDAQSMSGLPHALCFLAV